MRGLTNVLSAITLVLLAVGIGVYVFYSLNNTVSRISPHGSILSLGDVKVVRNGSEGVYVSVVATNSGTGPVSIVYPALLLGINVSKPSTTSTTYQQSGVIYLCASNIWYTDQYLADHNCNLVEVINNTLYIYMCIGDCLPGATPIAVINAPSAANSAGPQVNYTEVSLQPTMNSPRYIAPLSTSKIVVYSDQGLPDSDLVLVIVPYRYKTGILVSTAVVYS